jgi:hypothetical protein
MDACDSCRDEVIAAATAFTAADGSPRWGEALERLHRSVEQMYRCRTAARLEAEGRPSADELEKQLRGVQAARNAARRNGLA